MNRKNKVLLAVGTGLGVVLGYYANSKHATKMKSIASEKIQSGIETTKDQSSKLMAAATETIETVKNKGNQYLNQMGELVTPSNSNKDSLIKNEVEGLKKRIAKKKAVVY